MIPDALEEIYTTQKRLDENAHHDLKEYVENAHRHVQEMAKIHGFALQYGTRIGGYETVSPVPRKTKKKDVLIDV